MSFEGFVALPGVDAKVSGVVRKRLFMFSIVLQTAYSIRFRCFFLSFKHLSNLWAWPMPPWIEKCIAVWGRRWKESEGNSAAWNVRATSCNPNYGSFADVTRFLFRSFLKRRRISFIFAFQNKWMYFQHRSFSSCGVPPCCAVRPGLVQVQHQIAVLSSE